MSFLVDNLDKASDLLLKKESGPGVIQEALDWFVSIKMLEGCYLSVSKSLFCFVP
jgi:hypothetical protein